MRFWAYLMLGGLVVAMTAAAAATTQQPTNEVAAAHAMLVHGDARGAEIFFQNPTQAGRLLRVCLADAGVSNSRNERCEYIRSAISDYVEGHTKGMDLPGAVRRIPNPTDQAMIRLLMVTRYRMLNSNDYLTDWELRDIVRHKKILASARLPIDSASSADLTHLNALSDTAFRKFISLCLATRMPVTWAATSLYEAVETMRFVYLANRIPRLRQMVRDSLYTIPNDLTYSFTWSQQQEVSDGPWTDIPVRLPALKP